ncbi:MAG: CotH kinase family protein [Verrucomicrobiota bacterium]|nr:CotH kinase family protein [Verrucomicrobiota bacterium]MDP7048448.1 CotH kinase family protein [Verrucomicrobiota bacterium]
MVNPFRFIPVCLGCATAVCGTAAKELKLDELFPHDRLLEVNITVAEADWDKIRYQRRTRENALPPSRKFEPPPPPYSYVEASVAIDGVTFPKIGLRKKGFLGSQDTVRPSLKVKLDYTDKEGNIDGLRNLTFNNNRQDASLMSQFMGYAIWDAAGAPGSRCAFAKITVNGRDLGVYCHVETVREPLLRREFGSDKGTLFEGTVVDFYPEWEGSFERKTGDDKKGRTHIVKVINAMQGGVGEPFFGSDAPGRAWVPDNGTHDDDWFKPGFDDSNWVAGTNGAGYEAGQGFEKLITPNFNFIRQMQYKTASLYLRFPFEIDNLDAINASKNVLLRMKCDDGFVAYLNGHEVARMNAPENARWDARATSSGDDGANSTFAAFNLNKHRDRLRQGRNLLAIHGLNISPESTDFLMVAELQTNAHDYEDAIWEVIDEDAFYKFWALEGLLSFWDGYSGNRNNYFIYLNPGTGKLHFMPWGADCLFEKYSRLRVDRRSPRSVRLKGLVAQKLYQIPSVRKKYAATMKKLMAEHWHEDKLLAETKRIEAMVRPHISDYQWRGVRFEAVRDFIRNRRPDIEREINGNDMPLWPR